MRRTLLAATVALLLLAPGSAFADGYVTPFFGFNFGGDSVNCISLTACQDKQLNVGLSFRSAGRTASLEQDFSFVRSFFGPGEDRSVLTVMTNVVVALPAGPFQPYVVGGLGFVRPDASYNPLQLFTSKSSLGTDFGGGLTIMLGSRVGVRGDIRRFHALDVTLGIFTGEPLDFWRASIGLTINRAPSRAVNPYGPVRR